MHCFRAFLDSSSPLHHRGAPPPRWVPQSRSALSRSERVRATISVFTLTVLRRLINATSANSIKSKQGIVTQVGCPRHVLTRTRTRGAEGQRTQRRMGSNDPSSSTAAGKRSVDSATARQRWAATIVQPWIWTPSHEAGDCRFYAR